MAGVMDSVNQRTQLVGKNRLELLLFRLRGRQVYGINVFKVKEVLQCPKLSSIPKSRNVVLGVSHIRGETIPIIDLGMAIGLPPIARKTWPAASSSLPSTTERLRGSWCPQWTAS